uniref:Uncharacterized protein n=1 Tax=Chromera velia CCMP2878 TaxID=1169474 RepID=A0A0G4GN01_9ALVE|eukprot:Cvel_22618.t1-p1 / transcript=Cvel_22618.t1 / gene=Cvel_22618 / organism=Chromera_velia_CCMP2878 / gene_product=hypothetical protein / transcript_product=hypothetical protein / location=Cvel_scaffold2240:9459-15910(-) / protein_length=927 / sequence_SO=supercontig / SO=protein_coding / is_pseudo=false
MSGPKKQQLGRKITLERLEGSLPEAPLSPKDEPRKSSVDAGAQQKERGGLRRQSSVEMRGSQRFRSPSANSKNPKLAPLPGREGAADASSSGLVNREVTDLDAHANVTRLIPPDEDPEGRHRVERAMELLSPSRKRDPHPSGGKSRDPRAFRFGRARTPSVDILPPLEHPSSAPGSRETSGQQVGRERWDRERERTSVESDVSALSVLLRVSRRGGLFSLGLSARLLISQARLCLSVSVPIQNRGEREAIKGRAALWRCAQSIPFSSSSLSAVKQNGLQELLDLSFVRRRQTPNVSVEQDNAGEEVETDAPLSALLLMGESPLTSCALSELLLTVGGLPEWSIAEVASGVLAGLWQLRKAALDGKMESGVHGGVSLEEVFVDASGRAQLGFGCFSVFAPAEAMPAGGSDAARGSNLEVDRAIGGALSRQASRLGNSLSRNPSRARSEPRERAANRFPSSSTPSPGGGAVRSPPIASPASSPPLIPLPSSSHPENLDRAREGDDLFDLAVLLMACFAGSLDLLAERVAAVGLVKGGGGRKRRASVESDWPSPTTLGDRTPYSMADPTPGARTALEVDEGDDDSMIQSSDEEERELRERRDTIFRRESDASACEEMDLISILMKEQSAPHPPAEPQPPVRRPKPPKGPGKKAPGAPTSSVSHAGAMHGATVDSSHELDPITPFMSPENAGGAGPRGSGNGVVEKVSGAVGGSHLLRDSMLEAEADLQFQEVAAAAAEKGKDGRRLRFADQASLRKSASLRAVGTVRPDFGEEEQNGGEEIGELPPVASILSVRPFSANFASFLSLCLGQTEVNAKGGQEGPSSSSSSSSPKPRPSKAPLLEFLLSHPFVNSLREGKSFGPPVTLKELMALRPQVKATKPSKGAAGEGRRSVDGDASRYCMRVASALPEWWLQPPPLPGGLVHGRFSLHL